MATNNLGSKQFKRSIETAYDVGKYRPKKAVDTSKFNNLANNVSRGSVAPKYSPATGSVKTPDAFKNLGRISTKYGGSTKFESFHPGVDIANTYGTPIGAFTGGTVIESKTGQGWDKNNPSFGNFITIKDAQGNLQRYSHLLQNFVPVGIQIEKGQIIGNMGSSGGSYSPSNPNSKEAASHLDFRIWKEFQNQKQYYNPSEYLSSYTYK